MKKYYLSIVFLIGFLSFGQKSKMPTSVKVTYERTSNGNPVENQDKIVLFAHRESSLITSEKILAGKADIPYEKTSVDIPNASITNYAYLKDDKLVRMIDSSSLGNQKWELTNETKKILGYNCKKAKTVISSNWVEVWYTTELDVYGGPSVLGQKLGLVLQTVRNGNYHVTAIKIEKNATQPHPIILKPRQFLVDAITYRDELWKSRFVNIPVFKNQQVNFSDDTIADANTVRLQHGQVVLRKIKIPEIPAGSVAFLDVTEKSKGDAYDRTGIVFVVPTDNASALIDDLKSGKKMFALPSAQKIGSVKSKNQPPHLELMRFFTPFGISQYNTIVKLKNKVWLDSVMYRQEITDVLPAISGKEVVIGLTIGNYDKGGHEVSANITYHNESAKNTAARVVLPLFNTENFIERQHIDHNSLLKTETGYQTTFSLAAPVKNARLRYITTGHGGWENGDEFLQKQNTILHNGKKVHAFVPWRTDCGAYRLSNPASGNFENGLSSSDYSRSNWCPATATNPVWIDLGDLPAGEHTISVKIPIGEPEGESRSSWTLSGVLIGNE
ncbi:GLPGLI family protein [Flavobacterium selenitireducens]|uniref:GLPGLI family protein n=1 Tax=Flavobacterium selenitireducens TaxID=2722704 RepID=UPI00168AEBD7|nr:GLPGLI family protein [Flavobacterium selenitireducens]MBD3583397.1 GLPGLI family protein [Flavobacterium selenitireducens]